MNPNEQKQNTQIPTEVSQQPTSPIPKEKGGFPIKTFMLIAVLALATAILVTLAILPKKPVEIPTPVADKKIINPMQTTLTISSTPVALASPSSYVTDVVINTGQNRVTNAQLELSFDPKILTKVSITPGSFFVNPSIELENVDMENGRITFALSPGDGVGVLGQGILAKISFKTLNKNQQTTIEFLPKTKVTAEGSLESVLKSTVKASFNLGTVPTLFVAPTATPSARR